MAFAFESNETFAFAFKCVDMHLLTSLVDIRGGGIGWKRISRKEGREKKVAVLRINTGKKILNQEGTYDERRRTGSSGKALKGRRNRCEKDCEKLVGISGQREGRREDKGNASESARQ